MIRCCDICDATSADPTGWMYSAWYAGWHCPACVSKSAPKRGSSMPSTTGSAMRDAGRARLVEGGWR